MEGLVRLSAFFPALPMRSSSDRALIVLGAEPAKYMGMTLILSAALALLAAVLALILKQPALVAGGAVLVVSASFLLYLPKMELAKKAAEMESSMPYFLRALGMMLDMGVPFQRAIGLAAEGDGPLGREICAALRECDEGVPLQKALANLAASFPSLAVKRAVSQVISAYDTGSGGAEMRRIGDELLSLEQHRLKEFSAKSAMIGLLFIISSAVLPTFFMVYAIAGGSGIGQGEMSLAMLVLFPAGGVLLLMVSKAMMPRSRMGGDTLDLRLLAPAGAVMAGFLFPRFQLLLFPAGAVAGAYMALTLYLAERRLEDIEARLPDALFCASGLPKSARLERAFRHMEEGGFGALSEEAAKSRRQLEMNVRADAALDDLAARCRSPMLERACRMMGRMAETGSLDRLNSLAEDMIRVFQARRERAGLLAMQKYTLLLGALLIPLIMKMALSLLQGMGGLLGDGASQAAAGAASLVPPYIVIYAAISSAAIADAEGKRSSLAIYSLGLCALGLAAFHFINF
ncbi:MAG: type II secretion system F family protein [Candidatus Micrarchaeota archaeon]